MLLLRQLPMKNMSRTIFKIRQRISKDKNMLLMLMVLMMRLLMPDDAANDASAADAADAH